MMSNQNPSLATVARKTDFNKALPIFDYETLDTDTRLFVQTATQEIRVALRLTLRNLVAIGERLAEVKFRLDYKQFAAWVEAEFEMSERTAYNYIGVADTFGSVIKDDTVTFSIAAKALYMLSAPSTPESARQEAVELASSGTRVTSTKAKQIIAAHKPAPVPALPAPAAPEPVATITSEAPTAPKALHTINPNGHWVTEDGQILRYIPGADRAWCAHCADNRDFRETTAPDVWACKVCGATVNDDNIQIYEPPAPQPIRPMPTRPAATNPFGSDNMLADLQEAQRLLRKWWEWLPSSSSTRSYIDMALVPLGKAITSVGKTADPLSNPSFGKPTVQ